MRQLKIIKQVTNRDAISLEKYLSEIGKYQLITVDEEVECAKKIREGDNRALDKLVNSNLRFVVSVAKQYQNQGLALSDLINEGNLGLVKAAHRFDEKRGFKFISYAVWWIRQSIMQAIAEISRTVRLPLNLISYHSKVSKVFNELEQEFEREPTNEEIARALDVLPQKVSEAMGVYVKPLSFDAPINPDENGTMLDTLACPEVTSVPDTVLISESLSLEIKNALHMLEPRQADILTMYFGIGRKSMTLEAIGDELDLTRERVRQIKEKAIHKLKHPNRSKLLFKYFSNN